MSQITSALYSNFTQNYTNRQVPEHVQSFSAYCQDVYMKIIQHEGIESKALTIFNASTNPNGHHEWRLVEQFCNKTINGSVFDVAMPIHSLTSMNSFTLPIYGYVSPCLGLFTLLTNVLVCIVLLQKEMINPTNILLVAMAIADLLTGIIPIPVFIHTYTLGNYREWVSCSWAVVTRTLTINLPTVCHTASIWLTVALAVQRFLCVKYSLKAKQWCTNKSILVVIAVIYVLAFLSQWIQFIDSWYMPMEAPSVIEPWRMVPACVQYTTSFIQAHEDVYYQIYWWFRVLMVHFIPCFSLVILNAYLVWTMRVARARREKLMMQNRTSESRRLKESNSTTIMLVAVVAMFLLVEFPLAILMVLYILQSSFYSHVMDYNKMFQLATIIINLCILLSYPFNFVIYCGMSRQFRQTFKALFIPKGSNANSERYLSLATENGNNKHCVTQETAC